VRLNADPKELCASSGITYLDVFSSFVDAAGRPRVSCLLDDGVHLSDEGYRVWSAVVEEFLKSRGARG
jgi:lysophospholipase L1-like esterase